MPGELSAARLLFCGADPDWEGSLIRNARRRNLAFLRAFLEAEEIGDVYVLRMTSRLAFLREQWAIRRRRRQGETARATPVYVTRWIPERDWLPWASRVNRALMRGLVRRRLGPARADTVVWCYALRGMLVADLLGLEGQWFVDTDHDVLNDPNRRSIGFARTEALILRCARQAKRVFSASRSMLAWLDRNGVRNCSRLRNGVRRERFEARGPAPRRGARPRLGYVGVLSPWIDFTFLLDLARRHPEWQLVIAGPWYRQGPVMELERLDNVELMGAVHSEDVPGLLAGLDVGLGLYHPAPWLDVDSMKLYEYLAAGLPVVSTRFHPHLREDFEGLVAVAEGVSDFAAEVEAILGWGEDERSRWLARCDDFVSRNTWELRAREALAAIREGLTSA